MKTFEVTSGKIIVTDPCYEFDEGKVIPAKNGKWVVNVNTNSQGTIAELIAFHEDYYAVSTVDQILDFSCPVDSGQAGVFDADMYAKYQGGEYGDLNTFYGKACHLTCGTEDQSGVVVMDGNAMGAVSSSGYGDGNYEIAGFYSDGELYGIRISFDEELDEEELDEEDAEW